MNYIENLAIVWRALATLLNDDAGLRMADFYHLG